ncbi:MAG TPA: hypothetical protein VGF80_08225 [Galbitalea sp.]
MSDAPTQRFDAQPPAQPPASPDGARKSPLPLVLGIIGGALLIAVILLLVLLLGKNNRTPAASDTTIPPTDASTTNSTPVPVPTVTVTEAPPPGGNTGGGSAPQKPNGSNVLLTQYTISPTTIKCSSGQTQLHITWKSVNGYAAFFGVNTIDAQAAGMGWTLPASGSDHDFGAFSDYPYMVSCNTTPNSYAITVVGNGSKQTLAITLKQVP